MKNQTEIGDDLFATRSSRGVPRGADQVLEAALAKLGPTPVGSGTRTPRHRHRLVVAAAATVAAVIGASVMAVVGSSDMQVETAGVMIDGEDPDVAGVEDPGSIPDDVPSGFDPPAGHRVPLLVIDQPGFRITGGHESGVAVPADPDDGGELWVYRDPEDGLHGSTLALRPVSERWRVDDGEPVVVSTADGPVDGRRADHRRMAGVQWSINGREWLLLGLDIEDEVLLAAAGSVVVARDNRPTVAELPAGFELVGHHVADPGVELRSAEFGFVTDDHEGDIFIESGDSYRFHNEILDLLTEASDADTIDLAGRSALVVERRPDSWGAAVWYADGYIIKVRGSMTIDELSELARSVRPVDEETWLGFAPDDWFGSAEIGDEVSAVVADIPLPRGFGLSAVAETVGSGDRYQVIARVTGAVACAWIDRWVEGTLSGNQVMIDEAAAALAGARQWDALVEIADDGGWSAVVWEYADAVNGDGKVVGGRTFTVEESYQQALGCDVR